VPQVECPRHLGVLKNLVGRLPEVVPQVAKCLIGVGRVPDCAKRKKKPDANLSAFCVMRSVTPEADVLTCETASPSATGGRERKSTSCCRVSRSASRHSEPDLRRMSLFGVFQHSHLSGFRITGVFL
jgi:hypothetical protein